MKFLLFFSQVREGGINIARPGFLVAGGILAMACGVLCCCLMEYAHQQSLRNSKTEFVQTEFAETVKITDEKADNKVKETVGTEMPADSAVSSVSSADEGLSFLEEIRIAPEEKDTHAHFGSEPAVSGESEPAVSVSGEDVKPKISSRKSLGNLLAENSPQVAEAPVKTDAVPKEDTAPKTEAAPKKKAAVKTEAAVKTDVAPKKKTAVNAEAAPKKKTAVKVDVVPKEAAAVKTEAAPKKKAVVKADVVPKENAVVKTVSAPKKKVSTFIFLTQEIMGKTPGKPKASPSA